MQNKWYFASVPTLPLPPPHKNHSLFFFHFKMKFCVRAAQNPSQKCHCTSGREISWCLSGSLQTAPVFSCRKTHICGVFSRFAAWDLFSELEGDVNTPSASPKWIWKKKCLSLCYIGLKIVCDTNKMRGFELLSVLFPHNFNQNTL